MSPQIRGSRRKTWVCGSIPMAAGYPTSESPLRLRKTGLEKRCRSSERQLWAPGSRQRRADVLARPNYFNAENAVGVRIWLVMLATMGPSRSLSSRILCQAGSFWNAVHLVSRSASDFHGSM